MLIRCNALDGAILFHNANPVLECLRTVTRGWGLSPVEDAAPCITVSRRGRGYAIMERGADADREQTVVGAVCTLVMIVLNRIARGQERRIFLHAAAVSLDGRAVVFPATNRAGKSTLVAAAAFAGHTVIADDILSIGDTDGGGLAVFGPGVAPRLRLPVPPSLGDAFAEAADRLAGPQDRRYRYLNLPEAAVAALDDPHEISAFAMLQCVEEEVPPSLFRVDPGLATQTLLAQTLGVAAPPRALIDWVGDLATATPAILIRYRDPADAVTLLRNVLADTNAALRDAPTATPPPPGRPIAPAREASVERHPATPLVRRPEIERHERNSHPFLLDPNSGAIFGLDPLGDCIWDLLAEPIAAREIVETVAAVFPGNPREEIERGIVDFLARLRAARLVSVVHGENT
ncbi:MAG TPA: PqqD family peptide modification chaperone [Methylomirabilota bacterium]|nr:PqqD family peptide modification chaperone [Methylomirabilota bacterium]